MVLVSSRTFYRNQRHYMKLAQSGEKVVLKSPQLGTFMLTPISDPEIPTVEVDEETKAIIEEALDDYEQGRCLSFANRKELEAYLDTL